MKYLQRVLKGKLSPWEDIKEKITKLGITKSEYDYYAIAPSLTIGSKNEYVLKLKDHLYTLGFYSSMPRDGTFTKDTQVRVDRFRKKYSLSYSGEVGQIEQLHLFYKAKYYFDEKQYSSMNYKTIARSAETYSGNKYKFKSTVLQQIDEGNKADASFLVYVGGNRNMIAWLFIPGFHDWDWEISRLLEGDQITVFGVLDGYETYTTVEGAEKTVPFFKVQSITLHY